MLLHLLFILAGILLLYAGGEALVRSAAGLARAWGLSSLVIGLTVVAFGTSSPELAATLVAVFEGAPQVALGNVGGSNGANVGLILGLSALIYPLGAQTGFVRREVPFMLAVSVVLVLLAGDGLLSRPEGALLLALQGVYLWWLLRAERGPEAPPVLAPPETVEGVRASTPRNALGVALGILLLVGGAHSLITGAVAVARTFGVSDRVVGLTLVALGTSLPELAACLVAAIRREAEIILGGIVGSNIFNILLILGVTILARPTVVDLEATRLDLWVMLGLSALLVPFLLLGSQRVSRPEGAALLLIYTAYITYLFI